MIIKYVLPIIVVVTVIATVFSTSFRAVGDQVSETVDNMKSTNFTIREAKVMVEDMVDQNNNRKRELARLRAEIKRNTEKITRINNSIEKLDNELTAAKSIYSPSKQEYEIDGRSYTKDEVEAQIKNYLQQRKQKFRLLETHRNKSVLLLKQESKATKSISDAEVKIQEYKTRIAVMETESKLQEEADKYDFALDTTVIDSKLDDIEHSIEASKPIDDVDAKISFDKVEEDSIVDQLNNMD